MHRTISFIFLYLFMATVVRPALAGDGLPYVHQRFGHRQDRPLTVVLETGLGTREARPFGEQGFEQRARIGWAATSWLAFDAGGGAAFDRSGYRGAGAFAEVDFRILRQAAHVLDLHLGLGYLLDYQAVSVPRVRLTLERDFGRMNLAASSLFEIPVAENRDEVDLIVALAISYQAASWVRVGLELAGEDLEGFWEAEEAEGGAKIVLGPTCGFDLMPGLSLRLHMATIMAATRNQPTRSAVPVSKPGFGIGILGRLALGYSF